MDRLVMESTFADVDELYISNDSGVSETASSIFLGFKDINSEQAKHAFKALKNVTQNHNVELVICRTLISGIYDLEIKTDALDEPLRITNKMIDHETLSQIENLLNSDKKIVLATNLSEEKDWIQISSATVKECAVKKN